MEDTAVGAIAKCADQTEQYVPAIFEILESLLNPASATFIGVVVDGAFDVVFQAVLAGWCAGALERS